jgi:hypothetical protein
LIANLRPGLNGALFVERSIIKIKVKTLIEGYERSSEKAGMEDINKSKAKALIEIDERSSSRHNNTI